MLQLDLNECMKEIIYDISLDLYILLVVIDQVAANTWLVRHHQLPHASAASSLFIFFYSSPQQHQLIQSLQITL